jgi:outer membrane protein assembly factor BamE (lipoprotein component of BamABCDE complex)
VLKPLPTIAAALSAVLLLPGCGGGDTTFSTGAYDSIEQGDSADSVRSELGEPAAVQTFHEGAELWVYCDGSTPYYLALTDGEVSIPDLRPPDELRVSEQACG